MTSDDRTVQLTCEYKSNPLGIDEPGPRLSWQMQSTRRGARQTAFQVRVARSAGALKDNSDSLWDSGKIASDRSIHVAYAGTLLASGEQAWWQVRAWNELDQVTPWSDLAWWEMGLLERHDWQAQWIQGPLVGGRWSSIPAPFFRKPFHLEKPIQTARLYVTALGVYECQINGRLVGSDVLMPGWTDFHKRVRYQVYDVNNLLVPGDNVIGAILGDGWYCGHLEWRGRQLYGDRPRLLAQLVIDHDDGSRLLVTSDQTWRTAVGPLLEGDLIMGESYDARLSFPGWSSPDFDDSGWLPAQVFDDPGIALVATAGPPMRRHGELHPISQPQEVLAWPSSHWLFDFGQNLVGRVRLKVQGLAGTTITLRYGEMLDENGKLYTENLRTARQTDHYTLNGDGEELWQPRFTFHGFRYVEVQGYPGKPPDDLLSAVVLHSDMPRTGSFECSNPLVNQLQHNILWGQKGNFLDVPTDCPQRDERLGWTGDAQVFVQAATFNMDVASFFTKWQQDLADSQLSNGGIPAVAPSTPKTSFEGGQAWSDALLICPWTIYLTYGDRRLLERHYDSFIAFMDFLVADSPDLVRGDPTRGEWTANNQWLAGGFGDWLAMDDSGERIGGTSKALIGTAFFAHSAHLLSQIARTLGRIDDAHRFDQLSQKVRQVFIDRFVTEEGDLVGQTQTAYVLALHFDLLPKELRPGIVDALVADIQRRQMHLSTGFVGTPYLLHVLSDEGHIDIAYSLLLQTTIPSWLYPVIQGATTIWERWDGWTQDNGFQDPDMNSFNHYAYGSVGTFLYRAVAGIDVDPARPGFKHILLRPHIGGHLEHARASYQSPYGLIESGWRVDGDRLHWQVSVPPNATATAFVPTIDTTHVLESAIPVTQAEGLSVVGIESDALVVTLGSGQFEFESRLRT
ncbi:MAG: glycoside hydrolase family 78 protein [Chloroflexota bacterium]|nr:glycoside hydrolase family 78 protein [Chloroflexota bacterium]